MGNIYAMQNEKMRKKLKRLVEETRKKTIKEIDDKQNRNNRLREGAKKVIGSSKRILEEVVLPKDICIELLEAIKSLETILESGNFDLVQLKTKELAGMNDSLTVKYQEIKKQINGSDCFGTYEAYKLITENQVVLDKVNEQDRFFDILEVLASCKKGHAVSCMYKLIRDGEILDHPYCMDLLRKVSLTNSVISSDCLISLIKRHSLGKRDVHIAEIIVSYRSLSKLVSAHDKMFGRKDGFLEEGSKRDIALKTFEHFREYPDDGKGLFGCIDLFKEETDPTIERQLGQIYGEVLSLPHNKQILALKRAKQSLDYTRHEV